MPVVCLCLCLCVSVFVCLCLCLVWMYLSVMLGLYVMYGTWMGCVAAGAKSASNCTLCLAGSYSSVAGDIIVSLMYIRIDRTHRDPWTIKLSLFC